MKRVRPLLCFLMATGIWPGCDDTTINNYASDDMEVTSAQCRDGKDNDNDGDIDCDTDADTDSNTDVDTSTPEGLVEQILSGLTLEQKAAQMIQAQFEDAPTNRVEEMCFGSVFNGGETPVNPNTPGNWRAFPTTSPSAPPGRALGPDLRGIRRDSRDQRRDGRRRGSRAAGTGRSVGSGRGRGLAAGLPGHRRGRRALR
jgi:hypothetical protein